MNNRQMFESPKRNEMRQQICQRRAQTCIKRKLTQFVGDRLLPRKICMQKYFASESKIKQQPNSNSYHQQLEKVTLKRCKSIFDYRKNISNQQSVCLDPEKRPFSRKPNIVSSKIVRVPHLPDNYYSNLLDWSTKGYIAVAKHNTVCIINPANQLELVDEQHCHKKILVSDRSDRINSLAFSQSDYKIAIGLESGATKIYDFAKQCLISIRNDHQNRIGVLSWKNNLCAGSKDKTVSVTDIRQRKCKIFTFHDQQVCGIAESDNFIATGGNDNKVAIIDLKKHVLYDKYTHKAAVKAVCWSTDFRCLYTGGGNNDKSVKVWENSKGVTGQFNTGSQICSLLYSKNTDELITCQGYSLNQINIWSKRGDRLSTLSGHTKRVLYSCLSPSGQTLLTGAGDQTIRFWNIFPKDIEESVIDLDQKKTDLR